MKNLFALLFVTSLTTLTAQAAGNINVQFVPADDTAETNICLVAVEKGLRFAKQTASENVDVNGTRCNGLSIQKFVRKYESASITTSNTTYATTYEFVPADNAEESKVCTTAAKEGYKAALSEGGYNARSLYCNGTQIKRFAQKYANA